MFQNTSNSFTIRISSIGFYIGTIGVQGLLIDPSLVNNKNQKNVFLVTDYHYNAGSGQTESIAYQNTDVLFGYKSSFFTLYNFKNTDDLLYEFWINPIGTANIIKYASVDYVG